MCSPTRGALLTGRNHTRIGCGQICELSNDWDGFSGTVPKSSAMIAEVLRHYGYNTAAWGKRHNTPAERTTSKGPFDCWPTGYGFEYFHGFLAFAGFTEHADAQAGRVIDEIERQGKLGNTLVFYIWGDNGSSAEGQNGTISELLAQNGIETAISQHLEVVEKLGGLDVLGSPKTDNMYHAAWAWAGSSPYRSTKLIAAHLGGIRQPMAVS